MTMICPICGQDTQHNADTQVVKCRHCLRSFQLEPHMNTESQQQIAQKAANEIEAAFHCDSRDVKRFTTIILSAIERATEKDAIRLILEYENGDCSNEAVTEQLDRILREYSKTLREIKDHESVTEAAQPQRSELEGGIREIVNQYFGVEMSISAERAMERIAAIIAAQPQRSEQQDDSPHWTQANEGESETSTQDECVEAIVKWVVADTKAVFPTITAYDDTCLRKEVSFQVNAALTADREKIENLHKILGKKRVEIKQLKQDCLDSDKIIAQFSDQLTAERQRTEQATERYCLSVGEHAETKMQLLSALAAIEDFQKQITIVCALSGDVAHQCDFHEINASKWWKSVQKLQKMIVVDLSLLHEHDKKIRDKAYGEGAIDQHTADAEARKPLVDALTELLDTSKDVRTGVFPTEAHLNARKKSVLLLAKMKQ